jgi:ABC-2 type transport system permease protein
MSDVALAASQTRYSLVGFLRNPRALVFTVIMPLFLLLILNTIFHGLTRFIGARTAAIYYTPAIVSYQMMLAGFSSLNQAIVTDREAGLLKRFRGTPMPSWIYLTAEIARTLAWSSAP